MSYGGNLHRRDQGLYSRPGALYPDHSAALVPNRQQDSNNTSISFIRNTGEVFSNHDASSQPTSTYQGVTEKDVAQVQQQTRTVRNDTVQSLENSYRTLLEAQASADRSLVVLDEGGRSLESTGQNIQRGQLLTDVALDKTVALKKAQRSIFSVSINNPLTASKRKKKEKELQDQARERALRKAQDDALERDRIRQGEGQRSLYAQPPTQPTPDPYGTRSFYPSGFNRGHLTAEQQLYSFENTAEDNLNEEKIDYMITECIPGAVSTLRERALAMQAEVHRQNEVIDRLRDDVTCLTGEVEHTTRQLRHAK
ncbi:Protein transport protein S9 plasma membrane t-SNARE [Actinomortierella ambigua]|uniref:Protein transport protein S9 plasma membrane t-SNARE n=1 Tax=Actinomortierella ambigua TaxID=1343610 RepID=A0A9P6PU30_9FUNG|nr:Protein transport protein S9 plasma membrane t-SNARE [Actinomortierella ambigua]